MDRRFRDGDAAFDAATVELEIIAMPFVTQIELVREHICRLLDTLPHFVSTQVVLPVYFHSVEVYP